MIWKNRRHLLQYRDGNLVVTEMLNANSHFLSNLLLLEHVVYYSYMKFTAKIKEN